LAKAIELSTGTYLRIKTENVVAVGDVFIRFLCREDSSLDLSENLLFRLRCNSSKG
jgi:hypothetical protein